VAGEQQMMVHLDFEVPDLEAGVEWAIECGATLAEHQPPDDVRVLFDRGPPLLFVQVATRRCAAVS
jgi:hypothetical protein